MLKMWQAAVRMPGVTSVLHEENVAHYRAEKYASLRHCEGSYACPPQDSPAGKNFAIKNFATRTKGISLAFVRSAVRKAPLETMFSYHDAPAERVFFK